MAAAGVAAVADRGADLFAELPVEETVRVLKEGEKALNDDEYLTISFPKNFPIKMLEKRFKELTGKKCYFEFVEHTEMFIQFDDDRDYMMFVLRWS